MQHRHIAHTWKEESVTAVHTKDGKRDTVYTTVRKCTVCGASQVFDGERWQDADVTTRPVEYPTRSE